MIEVTSPWISTDNVQEIYHWFQSRGFKCVSQASRFYQVNTPDKEGNLELYQNTILYLIMHGTDANPAHIEWFFAPGLDELAMLFKLTWGGK